MALHQRVLIANRGEIAIRIAKEAGTLRVVENFNERLAEMGLEEEARFWSIEDDHGLIEVASTPAEVLERTGLEVR